MKEKILVIQTAFPGDAILTLPLIQKLADLYNSSEIDVISIPATAEIFSSSPYVNDVIVLDKKGSHKTFYSLIKFAKLLKEKKYSRVYSPHRSFRTSLLVLLAGLKNSTGFDKAALSFVYKTKIRYDKNHHEVQRNLSLLGENYEGKNWKILPEVKSEIKTVKKIDNYITRFQNKKLAAIAPGSVWNTKIYVEEYYNRVIEYLRDNDFEVVLIGGKSDSVICERIEKKFEKGVVSSAGEFSIPESIELLRNCEILICNDSAPTHMAMCADIPVLTIYCSTVPNFGFYPYNKNSAFVSYDGLNCKPCGIHGHNACPVATFDCAKKLLPEKVIEKIEDIIG